VLLGVAPTIYGPAPFRNVVTQALLGISLLTRPLFPWLTDLVIDEIPETGGESTTPTTPADLRPNA
jgi:hypothetical protein